MAGESRFFGRYYKLTIDIPDEEPMEFVADGTAPAMDIKFHVNYARGVTAREGTISILGLGTETINKILALSAMTRGKAMSHLIRIRLEAGYVSDAGSLEIIDGFAWYATVTAPPNKWLNIRISEVNPMGARTLTLGTLTGKNLYDVVDSVLKQFEDVEGVLFEIKDKTEEQKLKEPKECKVVFSSQVSLAGAIAVLNEQCSDKISFLLKTRSDDEKTRILIAVDKDSNKSTEGDLEINKDTGLLSVTGIDAVNGCITTFIDGQVEDEMSHLVLKSELNPQADGRYYIVKREYVGHYLGQEWYSRYYCSAKEGDKDIEKQNKERGGWL